MPKFFYSYSYYRQCTKIASKTQRMQQGIIQRCSSSPCEVARQPSCLSDGPGLSLAHSATGLSSFRHMFWASLICMGAWALKSILSFCSLHTKLAQAKNKIFPQNQKRKAKSMCSILYSRPNVTKPSPLPQEVPFFAIPNIIMMHRPTVSSNTVLIK